MFFVITVTFDSEILNKCEQIGFIVRSSRKYKFYLLFFGIFLYLIGLVVLQSNDDEWADQTIWIININRNLNHCKDEMYATGATRIGMQKTFEESSILFFMIGMGFGCSYSLVTVDCIDWVKTALWKRLLRAAIGCTIAVGIFWLTNLGATKDQHLTEFFINRMIPNLLIPFLLYGPYLILCQKIGLVDQEVEQWQGKQNHYQIGLTNMDE
mmetsp:Transcript_36910/g.56518  ORF Transcript_36910/g.56518 Transcript_36910/m.56518 type:complete len:211 (-) Transcript_36910:30-662(-)